MLFKPKPSKWAINQGQIDPSWQNLWLRIQQSGGGIWPFWEHGGDKVYNAIQGSPAGDFTFLNAGHTWKGDTLGIGVHFDGTTDSTHHLTMTSPNPGFWHDGFSQHCVLIVATLDGSSSGTKILYDLGGSSNGLAVGYRQSSGAVIFAVGASGVTEIGTTVTYTPHATLVILAQFDATDVGSEMTLIANGEIVTSSKGASPGTHSSDPGIGAANLTASAHNAFGEASTDEWPGTIMMLWSGHFALTRAEMLKVVADPFGIIRMSNEYATWNAGGPAPNSLAAVGVGV